MSQLKNYDVKQVYVIVGGVAMSGFADSSVVEIARNESLATLQVGADGEATISRSNNNSGTFKVKLQQTSPSNAVLSGFAKAFQMGVPTFFPVLVKDGSGNTVCAAEKAWIQKIPDISFNSESGAIEWVLETHELEMFLGGNAIA